MQKIFMWIIITLFTLLMYRYRRYFLRLFLKNKTSRRVLIKTVMEIPPLRRRFLRRYSPFAM
ncbi:hypothetical protein HNR44_000823 [Geomicrobium halophilum]|uniref:Uncharacterized protein n=1 Tax=Geomicrobium halophilum TaxID=549000 RepID=A0A841PMD5_9BACL|nr:hypothetical protein [Geomicrobium halophilum]